MIALRETVGLLLASGLSRRFGDGDKLLAEFREKPLCAHAAGLVASLPFKARMAVVPAGEGDLHQLLAGLGFELIRNPSPEQGRESSLRLGLAAALELDPSGIMIFLADMPHVEAGHVQALAAAADASRAAISSTGGWGLPPIVIPAGIAREALADSGSPIRTSLSDAVELVGSPAMLRDYDTAAELERDAVEVGE
jgi:molybdenum cofactor cytidylyltransferase